jgi:hypothetical protein
MSAFRSHTELLRARIEETEEDKARLAEQVARLEDDFSTRVRLASVKARVHTTVTLALFGASVLIAAAFGCAAGRAAGVAPIRGVRLDANHVPLADACEKRIAADTEGLAICEAEHERRRTDPTCTCSTSGVCRCVGKMVEIQPYELLSAALGRRRSALRSCLREETMPFQLDVTAIVQSSGKTRDLSITSKARLAPDEAQCVRRELQGLLVPPVAVCCGQTEAKQWGTLHL